MGTKTILGAVATTLWLAACAKPDCPQGSVFVPAGSFVMGIPKSDRTFPVWQLEPRKVTLTQSYCMDQTEVTNEAYDACGAAKACRWKHAKPVPESMRKEPKAFVDWADAESYCRWRGGRLPTEAEWEHAARYPDGRVYPWGDEPPTVERWHWKEYRSIWGPIDVGSFPKGRSYLGIDDLAGNLGEWVQDEAGYHSKVADVDPLGPDEGLPMDRSIRLVRGSSWASLDESTAFATYRRPGDRVYGDDQTGFRCVYPVR